MPDVGEASVGHPVAVRSGVVFTAWHDFQLKGRTSFVWRRFYSTSNRDVGSPLGRGWTSAHFRRIEEREGRLWLLGDEGHAHAFEWPSEDSASTVNGHPWQLTGGEGGLILYDRTRQHWQFYTASPAGATVFLLVRIVELTGNTTEFVRDEVGTLSRIEQPALGRFVRFEYGPGGLIRRLILSGANHPPETLVEYHHDEQGNLKAAVDPLGGRISYTYDDRNRMVCERNKLGGRFYFEYDDSNRCVRSWGDGNYMERRLVYDEAGQRTRVTDSLGYEKTFVFAENGVLEEEVDPLGNVTKFLQGAGVRQRIDAAEGTSTRKYNEWGQVVAFADALGNETKFEHNEFGARSALVDPGGSIWKRSFDGRGLLVAFTDPLGGTWSFERGQGGEIVREVDPEGLEVERSYGPFFRWQALSDERGEFRYEFDDRGGLIALRDPSGVIREFERDALGRVIRDRTLDGTVVRFEYDPAGNLTRVHHGNGGTWTFEYDPFNHLTRTVDPLGGVISVEYDTEGRRVRVTNQRGERLEEDRSPLGHVIRRRFFDGRVEAYEYDSLGRPTAVHKSDGSTVNRVYDLAGNLVEEFVASAEGTEGAEADDLAILCDYDWRGRLTAATVSGTSIEFGYDEAGRLVHERQDAAELLYQYDAGGRLVGREFVGGPAGPIGFEYDPHGFLEAIHDREGLVQRMAYDESGRAARRSMRGGFVEELSYDLKGRLREQVVASGGETLVHRRYAFDKADNLSEMEDSRRGRFTWSYDRALRLVAASRPGPDFEEFVYEPGGDLVGWNEETLHFRPGSQLWNIGSTEYEYDGNGNLCAKVEGANRTRYEHDARGRLVRVTLPDGSVYTHGYDALGRRLWKRGPAGETRYVWSNRVLAAVLGPEDEGIEYLVGTGSWQPVIRWVDDRAEHLFCNASSMPQEVVSPGRGLVWEATFSPFGQLLSEARKYGPPCDFRFPGQLADRETGLSYNYHRFYDPRQTRFLTPDPALLAGAINLYDYPRDPVNWCDPLGLACANPRLVESNSAWGWEIHEHDDGSLTITADATRGFATPKPGGLRATIHEPGPNAGHSGNAENPPEAHLGKDGRVIVMEGTHRSAAASRGHQIPPDPDNPHLGGVPGRPGHVTYEYVPDYNDNSEGVPLTSLNAPPGYPHQW